MERSHVGHRGGAFHWGTYRNVRASPNWHPRLGGFRSGTLRSSYDKSAMVRAPRLYLRTHRNVRRSPYHQLQHTLKKIQVRCRKAITHPKEVRVADRQATKQIQQESKMDPTLTNPARAKKRHNEIRKQLIAKLNALDNKKRVKPRDEVDRLIYVVEM